MLPPLARLPELTKLIDQRGYFVIHAPRQVGKTTAMLTLAQQLTASGRYAAIMVSAEVGATFPHDPGLAEAAILDAWQDDATYWLPPQLHPPAWPSSEPGRQIGRLGPAIAPSPSRVYR